MALLNDDMKQISAEQALPPNWNNCKVSQIPITAAGAAQMFWIILTWIKKRPKKVYVSPQPPTES